MAGAGGVTPAPAIIAFVPQEAARGLSETLASSPPLAIAVLFGAGVATSLTPCVYPMIPITASVISGTARDRQPWRRTLGLTMTYVTAMALLYAALGELVTEKSGVLNLGVEGMMITGAVTAFAAATITGSSAIGIVAGADAQLLHAGANGVDERIGAVADGDRDGDRHAPLAGRSVRGGYGGVRGEVDIRVGQHDQVVLGAAERLHTLSVRGGRLVHVPGDGRGPHEADGLHIGVLEQPVHGHMVAVHHVQHARREAGLVEELRDEVGGAGIAG